MKTSLIHYRVADFLKQHPPFQSVRIEDLIPLAQSGRVAFHSEGEIVYQEGKPLKPWIWVIQQGSVELLNENGGTSEIRDLLSAGDLLGVDRLTDRPTYAHSARTSCDVIVYALDAGVFRKLQDQSRQVDRYVRALLPGQGAATAGEVLWLTGSAPDSTILRAHLVCRGGETPVPEIAAAMLAANSQLAVIVDAEGRPSGVITDQVLRTAVAEGASSGTAAQIKRAEFPMAPLTVSLERAVLQMIAAREAFVIITADGTAATAVEGVITESTVQLLAGVSPSALIRRATMAESFEELALITQRIYALVSEQLHDASMVDWSAAFLSAFLASLTERLIALCRAQLEREGLAAPSANSCWMFLGAAGRGELLTPVVPLGSIVVEEATTSEELEWFRRLQERVLEAYSSCGLSSEPESLPPPTAQSLSAWKGLYSDLLSDPVLNGLDESRGLFDFRAVAGDTSLAQALHAHIHAELANAATAKTLLANDCLNRFPPLTFFQNVVVEMDGSRRDALNLSATALEPLADVGRVFALAAGDPAQNSTLERFLQASARFPEQAGLIAEAAEAFRILLLEQCRNGIREHSAGAVVYPAVLARYEQLLLKSAFRSVHRMLEFTYANAFAFGRS